jgi:hypothetical protein
MGGAWLGFSKPPFYAFLLTRIRVFEGKGSFVANRVSFPLVSFSGAPALGGSPRPHAPRAANMDEIYSCP